MCAAQKSFVKFGLNVNLKKKKERKGKKTTLNLNLNYNCLYGLLVRTIINQYKMLVNVKSRKVKPWFHRTPL